MDVFIGFTIDYLGLQLPVHPGHIVRALILFGLICFVLIIESDKERKNYKYIAFILVFYTLISSVLIGFVRSDLIIIPKEIYNQVRPLFAILLAIFIYKNQFFFRAKAPKIIKVNFVVFSINILFSYYTGIGLQTYIDMEESFKGFLTAGNSASILSLVFFSYYLFQKKKDWFTYFCVGIAFFNMYIVGTKVIFVSLLLVLFYLLTNIKWNFSKAFVSSVLSIPIIVVCIIFLVPFINDVILPRYLPVLNHLGLVDISSFQVVDFLYAYRRTFYAIEQISYQFSDVVVFLFGIGKTGQAEFWMAKGSVFTFAGMDYFDIMFRFGFIGLILFSFIIFPALKKPKFESSLNPFRVLFILMLLYSFFGGYVMFDLTAGTMFGFLLGLNLKS